LEKIVFVVPVVVPKLITTRHHGARHAMLARIWRFQVSRNRVNGTRGALCIEELTRAGEPLRHGIIGGFCRQLVVVGMPEDEGIEIAP